MKTMKRICLSLLLLMGTAWGARGESSPTNINPALLYYQSFILAPEPMSEADRNYLESPKAKTQKLPERFGKILADYDKQSHYIAQAAHATIPCDWGIDLSAAFNTLLPHLGRARVACRTAQFRALWALQHGHQDVARDELVASFTLGRNVASGNIFLVSPLVEYAIVGMHYETIAQNFGQFSAETLKQLVEGFDAAPAPHTIAASVPSERALGDWFLRKTQELQNAHPNEDAKVMAEIEKMILGWTSDTNFWKEIVAASGGTSQGIIKLSHEADPLVQRHAEIMALPEPEYEIQSKQFFADCLKSKNPFLIKSASGWQRIRPKEFKAQAQQAMLRAAVAYRINGESGLKSVMDPFGNAPFAFRRFTFKGVDRGFELKSAYAGADAPFTMIFVEKPGPAFHVMGLDAGKEIAQ
jgi:hypothetical protein